MLALASAAEAAPAVPELEPEQEAAPDDAPDAACAGQKERMSECSAPPARSRHAK